MTNITPKTAEASFMIGSPKAQQLGPECIVVRVEISEQLEQELNITKLALKKVIAGNCLKCGIGPSRETCAWPEACEHPGRVAALERNQALLHKVITRL